MNCWKIKMFSIYFNKYFKKTVIILLTTGSEKVHRSCTSRGRATYRINIEQYRLKG